MTTALRFEKAPIVEEVNTKGESDIGITHLIRDEEAEKSYG